jgi:DNA polymerase I
MGVTPAQIPDFKALAGDASDHYPGVAGIGPKTAVELLNKFTTVENLYKQLESTKDIDIKETVREKLIANKENALMSHNLATIRRNVPIEITVIPITTLDTPEVREELGTLGFSSLLKRLTQRTNEAPVKKEKTKLQDDSEQQALF